MVTSVLTNESITKILGSVMLPLIVAKQLSALYAVIVNVPAPKPVIEVAPINVVPATYAVPVTDTTVPLVTV